MRRRHQENPFHRIQRWNGSFYRPAELREVGTYVLVRHHTGEPICDTLARWQEILDSAEITNDAIEQDQLRQLIHMPEPEPDPGPGPEPDFADQPDISNMDDEELGDEEEFDEYFNDVTGSGADPALASATIGSLHRFIHTNGLHHIAMVSCQCHGEDFLPLDLFAAHLLPASLKRIRTLFTAQVLDHFRLCNLELKASAYQFYQLLRRLTRPMAPAEVLNLYREFRRMTRIWRWMKRLKWAGYAGSSKKVKEVDAGELAIFCPACPQPGINIPDNWREDSARHDIIFLHLTDSD